MPNGDKIGRSRLNRRQFMHGGLGTVALAALAMAGCSNGNNGAATGKAANVGRKPSSPAPGGSPAAARAAATPGPAGSPTLGAAALPKGSRLSFLGGTYFVQAGEDTFKQILDEWGKQTGVETSYAAEAWPNLQAKIGAQIQAGAGPDLMGFFWFWPSLYADNLVDLGEIAGELDARWGGFADAAKAAAQVGGNYLAVPLGAPTDAIAYRTSYLKRAGFDKFPDSWDELFRVSASAKKQGKPFGLALGHTLGDPLAILYPFMYSYGATEVLDDKRTPGFDTPEFTYALQRFVQAWKEGFDETGLSGDDNYNNSAFLADQIWATNNSSSIYLKAKTDNPKLAADLDHAANPQGPKGRFATFQTQEFAVLKYSKNQPAAKEFLRYFFSDEVYMRWVRSQQGYYVPPTKAKFLEDPVFTADPKLKAYLEQGKLLRLPGYAAEPGPAVAASMAKYVIVDMFAEAVQSGNAKQAISNAAGQIKTIYAA